MAADQGKHIDREALEFLWNYAEVGCALIDDKGRFLHVNEKFCLILEYSSVELKGMNYQEITHPADALAHAALSEEVSTGRENDLRMTITFLKKSGYPIQVSMVAHAIRDNSGEIRYLLSQLVPRVNIHSGAQQETNHIDIDSSLVVTRFLKDNKKLVAAMTALMGSIAAVLGALAQRLI